MIPKCQHSKISLQPVCIGSTLATVPLTERGAATITLPNELLAPLLDDQKAVVGTFVTDACTARAMEETAVTTLPITPDSAICCMLELPSATCACHFIMNYKVLLLQRHRRSIRARSFNCMRCIGGIIFIVTGNTQKKSWMNLLPLFLCLLLILL